MEALRILEAQYETERSVSFRALVVHEKDALRPSLGLGNLPRRGDRKRAGGGKRRFPARPGAGAAAEIRQAEQKQRE